MKISRFLPFACLSLLAACVTVPSGPSVLVLPGSGKNFEQFRADDIVCRQFASEQIGGATPGSVASDSGVRSAAVGTILGAAAGAAANGGRGAGVGAGAGMAIGGMAGAGAAESSQYGLQQRYDMGYEQCMYAKGNRVPMSGSFGSMWGGSYHEQPSSPPPPPPGMPPPR